jgi:hypothetical protein
MENIAKEYDDGLNKFGYQIEFTEDKLTIIRKMKMPLFFWAYIILFILFLVTSGFNAINFAFGLIIFLLILVLYFRNTASQVIIDRKAESIIFKKGILRRKHYKRYNEVKALELKMYDVPASASPFEKSNREYIAEIRLVLPTGLPVDLLNLENRDSEKIEMATAIHQDIIAFSGLIPLSSKS